MTKGARQMIHQTNDARAVPERRQLDDLAPVLDLRRHQLLVLPADAEVEPSTDLIDWCTRGGVAALLFVNGLAAFITPETFRKVLEENVVASRLPEVLLDPMVMFAGVNDVLLGLAIISGRQRKLAWAWLAAWLAVIAGVKLLNMVA